MIQLDGIKAVIFDFDGVVIESESIAYQVWCEVLGPYGKNFTEEIYHNVIGRGPLESVEYLIEILGHPLSPQELLETYWSERTERVCRDVSPAPGIIDLMQFLMDRGLVLGVASNSPSRYVIEVLEAMGLAEYFGCVRCREDVVQGKPAADVYLAAAACLEVDHECCLALEDSPIGLQAALNAGMRCIVVPNEDLKGEDFSGAEGRFGSLSGVLAALS
ncbi:MAG: HAD family phosphatase [Anaerolineales bacterium]|nr:MAG: HAD family phosphatase [Anaerolineales bacterium]